MKKIAVNTKTQKEYDELMEILDKDGYSWVMGEKTTDHNFWSEHKNKTCIDVNDKDWVSYSNYQYFEEKNYKILTLKEFKERNMKTLEEKKTFLNLKAGDTILDSNGDKRFILAVLFQDEKRAVYLLSCPDEEDINTAGVATGPYTSSDLEACGFTLPNQKEEEPVELTLDEVADKFGVDVKNLKIKKD